MLTKGKFREQYVDLLLAEIESLQMLTQVGLAMEVRVMEIYYHPTLYAELINRQTPKIEREAKLTAYLKSAHMPIVCQNFLLSLLHNDLFEILDDQDKPATFLSLLRNRIREIRVIQLTTADYLSDYMMNWLHLELMPLLQYKFVFDVRVDPSLISGMMIQSDSFFFSDTTTDRLEDSKSRIKEKIHEITKRHLAAAIAEDFSRLRRQVAPIEIPT